MGSSDIFSSSYGPGVIGTAAAIFWRSVSLDCADSLIWSDSEGTEGSDPSRVFERDTPGDCLELGV